MNINKNAITPLILASLAWTASYAGAQSPAPSQRRSETKPRPFFFGTAPNLPVLGGGTVGQLTKWTGFNSSNSFIGDSIITETKLGQIGIGTTTPASTLTVQGMIETLAGGLKFPDGTVQTTAGLASIFHDGTLAGNGTSGSPLGVSIGGVGTPQLANGAVNGDKIAPGAVGTAQLAGGSVTEAKIAPFTAVRSVNGLFDSINLAAGANISLTPSGSTLTIAAPNSLAVVQHDSTLTGDGTSGSPLGVATASSITAFFSKESLAGNDPVNNPGKDVVSKTVPAGSYAIFVNMEALNIDNDQQDLECTLSTGASFRVTMPHLFDANKVILSLQDAGTFNSQTTIKTHCTGFNVLIDTVALTAIRVATIQ